MENRWVNLLLSGILVPLCPYHPIFFLAASLIDTRDPVMSIGYITVSIGVLALATVWRYIRIKELPPELIPSRSAGQILAQEWPRLIPLLVLAVL